MAIDVLLIVPFEPASAACFDPKFRQVAGAAMSGPIAASLELEYYVGRPLNFWRAEERPVFGNESMPFPSHRSLTAMVLASNLERAGLTWRAIDPGVASLHYWRQKLFEARASTPRTVALSTTFIITAPWLRAICALARQAFPDAQLLVGGYYYATNSRQFLNLDADVLCVGEGEKRLPELVGRIRAGAPIDDIPGLYIRTRDGRLRHTGHVDALTLDTLAPVNWRLASRIDPPVDLNHQQIEFGVETQRGCVFKCEFCTYRTLARPAALSPEHAVDAIMSTAEAPLGYLTLTDSTATYPHERWDCVMQLLADRGGSPHPLWAFARVSDITDERARLMARAGVRQLFIGQESGDQAILNLMKKGTRVSQVKPALRALRAHGIGATFGFIHGFPGENESSMQRTRSLIADLNEPSWSDPTVFAYILYPFIYMDFASVSRHDFLGGVNHYLGYEAASVTPARAVEEVLATFIAVSRVPHAPLFFAFPFLGAGPPTNGMAILCSAYRLEIFRWLKAVERGVAIFLERDLDGRRPDARELRGIRDTILRHFPHTSRLRKAAHRLEARLGGILVRRLQREWRCEVAGDAGLITRAFVAGSAACWSRDWRFAASAWRTGTIPERAERSECGDDSGASHAPLADALVQRALSGSRTAPPRNHEIDEGLRATQMGETLR